MLESQLSMHFSGRSQALTGEYMRSALHAPETEGQRRAVRGLVDALDCWHVDHRPTRPVELLALRTGAERGGAGG